jgi:hypothetical protein
MYRAISFWLPTIPGVLAYISLVRERRQPAAVRHSRRPHP